MMFLWMRVDASMCLSLVMASVMAAWGVERVAVVTGDVGAVEAGVAEALDEFEDGVFEVGFGEGGLRHCWGRVFWCLFEAVMSIFVLRDFPEGCGFSGVCTGGICAGMI